MKSLEEMLQLNQSNDLKKSTPTTEITDQSNIDISEITESEQSGGDEIPAYIYTDPQIVGYSNELMQADLYDIALTGTIPFTGETSVLDIGCGRGDLAKHIGKTFPSLKFEYVGYETNKLLESVGSEMLLLDGMSIKNEDFMKVEIGKKFNQVYMIGSLNLNYGWDANDWDYLELMLRKAIDVANESVTFILLHDNGGEDYISYPIPNVTELVLKFNLPFIIDYGRYSGVYKITIKKQPIF